MVPNPKLLFYSFAVYMVCTACCGYFDRISLPGLASCDHKRYMLYCTYIKIFTHISARFYLEDNFQEDVF